MKKLFDWQRKIVERYEDRENLGLFFRQGLDPLVWFCRTPTKIIPNGKEWKAVSGLAIAREIHLAILSTKTQACLNYEHLFNRGTPVKNLYYVSRSYKRKGTTRIIFQINKALIGRRTFSYHLYKRHTCCPITIGAPRFLEMRTN